MNDVTPTVGRDVHYVAYGTPGGEYQAGAHRAAKVTEIVRSVWDDAETALHPRLSLVVFNPTGLHFVHDIPYDGSEEPKPGTWHWPERM
jgi:hypothetical protein